MFRIAEALPIAVRHLSGYAELLSGVANEWWRGVRAAMVLGALSLACAVAALTASSVWALPGNLLSATYGPP
jgi:hypothetical protein